MSRGTAFQTKAELCVRFIEAIGDDWVGYPETDDWDILLSRKADGFQIGIQAKLHLNAHVISQALEDGRHWMATRRGPDCRAILVPNDKVGYFDKIAAFVGITIIRVHGKDFKYTPVFHPALPKIDAEYDSGEWFEMCMVERCRLPDYVPDVTPGVPCPIRLTPWKIAAIKLAILLDHRGYVTRGDFKHLGINHRGWIAPGNQWLRASEGRFLAGENLPNFKRQHPKVYAQIESEYHQWKSPESVPEPKLDMAALAEKYRERAA